MNTYEWFEELVRENLDDEAFCRQMGDELVADGELTRVQVNEILDRAFLEAEHV